MKKKVVWMSDVPFANSGMGIQSKYAVVQLLEAGYEVVYYAWYVGRAGESTDYKISPKFNIPVFFLGKGKFGDAALIQSLLEMHQPDVFITYGDMHMVNEVTKIASQWQTIWAHWWPVDCEDFDPKINKIAQAIPYLITTTQFGARIINKITGQTPPIIGHVVQFEEIDKHYKKTIRSKFGLKQEDVVFGCVARNFWRKNLSVLIRSFAEASRQNEKIRLVIHTDSAIAQNGGCDISLLVNELGISGKVFLSNNSVTAEDMAKLYDLMDYHVLTSFGEGFGVPVIESMARGIPNIVPNNTTLPELVRDTGYIVPLAVHGNVDPMSNKEFFGPCPEKLSQTFCLAAEERYTKKYELHAQKAKTIAKEFCAENVLPKWVALIRDFVPNKISTSNPNLLSFKTDKPKALLCSMFYVPNLLGGGEYTIHELMKGLVENGWECKVLTMFEGIKGKFREPLPDTTFMLDGVEVTHCGKTWYETLERLLKSSPPDVLITYEIFSWMSLRFLRAAKKYNIRTVMYEQFWRLVTTKFDEVLSQPINPPQEGLECSQKCDLLIANSDHMQDVFVKFLGRKCPVVYPPMDLEHPEQENESEKEYILFVNPGRGKGANTVFYLADKFPEEKFMFVGAIAEDETFLNMKKRSNIEYHEHTDNMGEIYNTAKIVLFPSTVAESFGRVPLEAMSYGVPVIARGVGAVPQNLEAYAVVIDRQSDDVIWAHELKKLLQNPTKTKKYGLVGQEFARKKFNKEIQTKKFSELLLDLRKQPCRQDEGEHKKIISICDPGYLGVDTALKYAQEFFGKQFFHFTLPTASSIDELVIDILQKVDELHSNVIIYAGWNQTYDKARELIRKTRPEIKHVVNWHSPLAQIEMSNEVAHFVRCNNMLCKKQIDYIFVPYQPDADLFRRTYHPNYRWFPDTIGEINMEKRLLPDKNFKIGFFATPSPRKNILAQLSAVRTLHLSMKDKNLPWKGITMYLGNGFDKQPHYMNFLKSLDIPYVILPHFTNKNEYYSYLGAMDVNMQVTFSEAFNYVCAESLALGVPCLGSKMTPALRSPIPKINQFIEKFLIVSEIDNVLSIFSKLQFFTTLPEELKQEMKTIWHAHTNVLRQMHNKAIEELLNEF